jgi:histidine decarboxylase
MSNKMCLPVDNSPDNYERVSAMKDSILRTIAAQKILPHYFKAINHRGQLVTIEIRTIRPDDDDELYAFAKTMARIFAASEPMTVAVGITEEECFEEICLYLQYAKKDGLSLILTNQETGKIIGGIIGRDFYNDEAEDPYVKIRNNDKFRSNSDVLNVCRKQFINILKKEGYTLNPGIVYRGAYIGFLSKYLKLNNEEGYNITALSFRKFEEYLKNLGYKYFYGEATNPGSQKLFRSSGWTIDEIVLPYVNYPPFNNISFHHHALPGIDNSLCGAIQRLNTDFPEIPNNLLDKYNKDKDFFIASTHNMDITNAHLAKCLDFYINNNGNSKNHLDNCLYARDEEQTVLNFISNIYKLPASEMWGYITAGGTEANEMGLYLARNKYPDGIVYASADSHYSVKICSHKLGMTLLEIPSLNNGEIDYVAFEKSLKEHKQAAIVNVNIGTTMKGAIDDVDRIIAVLKNANKEFYIHCDAALHGGFLPFLKGAPKISFDLPIDSLAISLHKFMGMPFPAATFLSRSQLLNYLPQHLTKTIYNGKKINTLFGSRNGQAAIFAYSRIIQLGGVEGITKIAEECIKIAEYTENKLKEIGYPGVLRNPFSNIVAITTPPIALCKKWQLPGNNDLSHVIIMPHVTKIMIDEFISDIKTITQVENTKVDFKGLELVL